MNEVLNIESDRLKKIVFKNVMDFQNKLKQNFDSGYKQDLFIYLEKLYIDVLPPSYFQSNTPLLSLLHDPEDVFDNYFENLFDKLHNENNNELKSLKNKMIDIIRNKYNEIKKKMKETDKDILFLEEIFIQSELKQKISFVGIQEKIFEFKDRQILHFHDYKFSELSCRYIFSNLSPFHHSSFLPHLFYPQNIYSTLLSQNHSIISFQNYPPLLKYWLYYILSIENIFKKDINIDSITKWKSIYELSKKLKQFKRKNSKNKHNKKKKKKDKQRGGISREHDFFKKKGIDLKKMKNNKHTKNHSQKINNPESSKVNDFLKKVVIHSDKIISLYDYFNGVNCENLIDNYYTHKIEYETGNDRCVKDTMYPLLFKESEKIIKPSLFIQSTKNSKNHHHRSCFKQYNFIDSLKKNIKINQILYNYDETVEPEMKNIGNELYNQLCIFYLSLYFKKKFIYTRFISTFDKYLEKEAIQISSEPNKSQNNKSQNNQSQNNQLQNKEYNENENHENENHENNQKNRKNQNKKINTIILNNPNMENKYQLLQRKIEFLENKKKQLNISNLKYDEKILTIDKYIRDLKIQKQNIRRQN